MHLAYVRYFPRETVVTVDRILKPRADLSLLKFASFVDTVTSSVCLD